MWMRPLASDGIKEWLWVAAGKDFACQDTRARSERNDAGD